MDKKWLLTLFVLAASVSCSQPRDDEGGTIAERIAPPEGYARVALDSSSFAFWLRNLPLKPGRPQVRLYNGGRKWNQTAHHAVLEIDVGERDLQQCADAVMRLRAEYLWAASRSDDVAYNFTSGDKSAWSRWRDGWRPRVSGSDVEFERTAAPDSSYPCFRRYLDNVFMYAGSYSLSKELQPVSDPAQVQSGDVFIQGGFPGHAVIVVDVAANADGDRVFLLAQSYMPAQDIHVLRNSDREWSPWYRALSSGPLVTPQWNFEYTDLKRFGE